jgi:hypothetical protein
MLASGQSKGKRSAGQNTSSSTRDPTESLGNTIFRCKRSPALQKLGEAVVVFLLCRVGDSGGAETFLKNLEEDTRLKDTVYCSSESIDEELAVFQRVKDNTRYFGWVSFNVT